jgi:hypothetical protein
MYKCTCFRNHLYSSDCCSTIVMDFNPMTVRFKIFWVSGEFLLGGLSGSGVKLTTDFQLLLSLPSA